MIASDGSIDAINDVNRATTNGSQGGRYMELQPLKLATVEPKFQQWGYSKDWFEPARNFPQVMCIAGTKAGTGEFRQQNPHSEHRELLVDPHYIIPYH